MAHIEDDFDDVDKPRTPEEIAEAEKEFFDLIWYHRKLVREQKLRDAGDRDRERLEAVLRITAHGKRTIEEKYAGTGKLGPYTDFELGVLHGKLSFARWALGDDWDNFDT
jgi:hypothetical protein